MSESINKPTLFLVRGLPGSGKTEFAKTLCPTNISADYYAGLYTMDGFQRELLPEAHKWCQDMTEDWMRNQTSRVAVHNTFVQEWEMEPYLKLAETYGYKVVSLIVENRHGSPSLHGVPSYVLERMAEKFQVCLNWVLGEGVE